MTPAAVAPSTAEPEGRGWRPLLDRADAEGASEVIERLAVDLRGQGISRRGSLAAGDAGTALFFAYLGEPDTAAQHLDAALADKVGNDRRPSLFGGPVGPGWVLAHLAGAEADEACSAFDLGVLDILGTDVWADDFDLANGLVGLGVYALERLPHPRAETMLGLVVHHLTAVAETTSAGVTWFRGPALLNDRQPGPGWYDLGMAHGVAGVVAFLGRLADAGIGGDPVRALLERSASWLLEQRLPAGTAAVFPSGVGPGDERQPSRCGWCYGDPGIAAALLFAAPDDARAVALAAAARPVEKTRVGDAALCHGASGLGHLYNRLFQATRDERLASAARFWFARALELPPLEDAGFLEGRAGLGLALLAAISVEEPAWDRVLLLSPGSR